MVFSSFIFIFAFLPITLAGFAILGQLDSRWSKVWLCLASLVFYSWWDIAWLPVLLTSVAFNYLAGFAIIHRANKEQSISFILPIAIAANILALIYYKYLAWLLQLLGLDFGFATNRALPLGISFFTFTQIAFLVDISQGFHQRYSPVNYLLFVTFFPHLIAGPIVHHRDLMPQFEEEKNYRLQWRECAIGSAIFAIGLAKKTLIAETMGEMASNLLSSGHRSASIAWIGAIAYSMQLYFDFSGYSDMAIGLARLFGIKFPINFDSPYKARSIIDFWQRWHITLTRFLTAYTYNPIALFQVRRRAARGLSTSKKASQSLSGFLELIALPTFNTMLLAGIWHGAGLQFVIFGALHGAYITINHAWRTFGPRIEISSPSLIWLRTAASCSLVYLCVLIAQMFFRASSAGDAVDVLSDMFMLSSVSPDHASLPNPKEALLFLTALAIVWLAPNTQRLMMEHDPALMLGRRFEGLKIFVHFNIKWAIVLGLILFIGLLNIRENQLFIYFQF
jgi:alginate O-acetyltransferase complex protein AlgI